MAATPTPNPAVTARLVHYGQALLSAGHGRKEGIYQAAMAELQLSRATVIRKIKEVSMTTTRPRKRRSDAGNSALTRDEARVICLKLMDHIRKNGKRLLSVDDAVDDLRVNGMIQAGRTDADGVIRPLSTSAIISALRMYRLHPDQLLTAAPAVRLASRHPNHVWQIDASRSIMFYLPAQGSDTGLRIADHADFYKNKPANVIRVIQDSLWRYVVTDHASGALFAFYVTGGETGGNLAEALIQAMHARDGNPFHGVPKMVMLDPGGANTSPPFLNLCKALQIQVQINRVKNPRAKGQVEKGQDLVERNLESMFNQLALETLDQVNMVAAKWNRWFNATKVHSRHGMTRFEAWMHITSEELVVAPGIDLCRELAVSAPADRVVNDFLEVEFLGCTWDVSGVPGVIVGQKLQIVRNAWRADSAQAVGVDADGREVFHVLPRKDAEGAFNFPADAAYIGESHKAHADTVADLHRKEIELFASSARTQEDAAQTRKARSKKGRHGSAFLEEHLDPLKRMEEAVIPHYLPRQGTALDIQNPVAPAAPELVDVVAAMSRIAGALGRAITRDENRFIKGRWPDGMTEDELLALIAQFRQPATEQPQRAAGGLRAL